MPSFIDQLPARVRKDPLGPTTLNQAHANVEQLDALLLREHFDDGQHNALEVPWVLGHVDSGTTGSLFNTAYGGSSIARPAAGECTVNVATGVIGSVPGLLGASTPACSVLANVSDADIVNRPYTVTAEVVSATSIKTRVRRFISTLGSPGNSWDSQPVAFDLAVHAQKQAVDPSVLLSYELKQRRDFLTEAATDWNALVQNQATAYRNLTLEHTAAGAHNGDRIAKACGWFRPDTGPTFVASYSEGVDSVSRISTGVIEVTLSGGTLSSTNLAACFPQAQPASDDEIIVINGRAHSTKKFRFYIYRFSVSENKWDRDDRPFFAAMFGRWA